MPALPLDEAGKYVAGAYVVFLSLLLIYIAIMAARLQRIDRELAELADLAERGQDVGNAGSGRDGGEVELAEQDRPTADPDGADAGAEKNARGVAEGKVLERERSSRQEVFE
jgi:hypothetical protein